MAINTRYGGTMKVGDLVTCDIMEDSIGIIVSQFYDWDRWVILWSDGYQTMYWGKNLEVISESR